MGQQFDPQLLAALVQMDQGGDPALQQQMALSDKLRQSAGNHPSGGGGGLPGIGAVGGLLGSVGMLQSGKGFNNSPEPGMPDSGGQPGASPSASAGTPSTGWGNGGAFMSLIQALMG